MLYGRIQEKYDSLTHSQKQVAGYLDNHSDDVVFCTLEDLASRIEVSTTTIIRFARALGYSGFSDMQNDAKRDMQNKATLPERLDDTIVSGPEGNLLQQAFSLDIENIRLTLAAQKTEDLRETIRLIAEAGTVYIMGMRSSFALAHYLASRLGEMKQNVRFIQSSGMIYPEEIVGASERDVCIAYVFPRYSKTAISVLSWMRSKGVRIILVTALGDAPVRRYADVCLGCATRSVSYKNSMTAPICLTNYLVAEYARQHYEEARETLTRTEEILSVGFYLGI